MTVGETRLEQTGRRRKARRSPWPLRAALLYLALLVAIAVTSRAIAERQWWSTFLLYLPQGVYLAPAPLLLLWAAARRDGRALLATGAAALLVAGPMMGFHLRLPRAVASQEHGRVRVLAYNIQGALEGFERVRDQVDRYRPDVVVFSEATGWGRERELGRELAAQFAGWHSAQMGEIYVASRWPVIAEAAAPLPDSKQRAKVRLVVDAPFGRFQVVGAHFFTAVHGQTILNQRRRLPRYLRSTGAVRLRQVEDLLAWARERPEPLILAGDFNTPPGGMIYGALCREYTDAFAEQGSGWGYTYPARLPLLRIDYVFHGPGWRTVACEVGARPGSDHRPLYCELALTPGTGG